MKTVTCIFIAALTLCAGCAHKFETSTFDPAKWEPGNNRVNGIIYYEPQLMRIQYTFTSLINGNGQLIGTVEDKSCKPVIQKEELRTFPNYAEPRVLINKPSIFSSGKLSATLKDGMLISINSESTPQLPELVKQITGAEGISFLENDIQGEPLAACNASPVITDFGEI